MEKNYLVVLQCHIAKETCPEYLCEKSFNSRTGKFTVYPEDSHIRMLSITCGGCSGRATHRKLSRLIRSILKAENITKDQIAVHLSSCVTNDSYHGPPCPHLDYLKKIINEKLGLDIVIGTYISEKAEKRRAEG